MTDLRRVLVPLWILAALPAAASPVVGSETVVQLRHDLFGKRMVPVWEYVHFEAAGKVDVEGYAGLEWVSGIERTPRPHVYMLAIRGDAGNGEWTVGRFQATTLRRRQSVDGARYAFGDRDAVRIDAWGGYARSQDLDDFLDGAWVARVMATHGGPTWVARGGVQVDVGKGTKLLVRQDLETTVAIGRGPRPVRLHGLIGVAQPTFTAEWARVEVGGRPISEVQTTVFAQHREAPDPEAVLGDAILHDIANGGVDQVGVELRWFGVGWAQLHGSYAISSYDRAVDPTWGHSIDVRYLTPPEQRVRLIPAYSFRSGPGGVYHAAYGVVRASVTDAATIEGRVAAVPFRRGGDPWSLAANVGTTVGYRINRQLTLRGVGELASDTVYKLDLRIGAVVDVRWP